MYANLELTTKPNLQLSDINLISQTNLQSSNRHKKNTKILPKEFQCPEIPLNLEAIIKKIQNLSQNTSIKISNFPELSFYRDIVLIYNE